MQNLDNYKLKPDQFAEVVTKRAVVHTLNPNQTNQKILGVSDEVLERYYQTAWRLLEEKNWFDAMDAFLFLNFLNPFVHAFWIGLGIAQQSQKKYSDALVAYTMAEATDPTDPVAFANAFQCGLAIGEHDFAKYSLEKAIECCADKPEFADLKQKLLQLKIP